MAKSRNEYLKVRLGGRTLVAFVIYSLMMIGMGAMIKSCDDNRNATYAKVVDKQQQMTK